MSDARSPRLPANHAVRDGCSALGLATSDLWLHYVGIGGNVGLRDVDDFMAGRFQLVPHELDVLVQALNDRFVEINMNHPVPYSDQLGPASPDSADPLPAGWRPSVDEVPRVTWRLDGMVSRTALDLHRAALWQSIEHGTPGWISDRWLSDGDGAATPGAAELCSVGAWRRWDDGYVMLDRQALAEALDRSRDPWHGSRDRR